MAFELAPLPYAQDALAPYLSAETLEYHHGKHHKTYVDNLNKMLPGSPFEGKSLEEIVVGSYGNDQYAGFFNNSSQIWNHDLLWKCMKPHGGGAIPGRLEAKIKEDFGSVDKFKEEFAAAAVGQFGSGWAWLVSDGHKLSVLKTPNGVNPPALGKHALLTVDVWEHAYYIDYRNKRADWIKAFNENLVNWEFVEQQFESAKL